MINRPAGRYELINKNREEIYKELIYVIINGEADICG
jgi:hypothetical protein